MKKMMLGLALLLWGTAGLFAQAEIEAVIRELSGTVEIKAPGETGWSPARRGQRVTRNTVISTGFKSSALVALGNSTLSVLPLTRLSIEELLRTEGAGGEKVDINLWTGRIRVEVKPPAGGTANFTVRSPTATASVRGTSFEFDGIRVSVDEGRVHMTGGDRSGVYVGAGHRVSTDMETGRTTGAAESAREDLTPPAPAGIDILPEVPAPLPPAGDIEAGFEWK
jgi:hypothetical protein